MITYITHLCTYAQDTTQEPHLRLRVNDSRERRAATADGHHTWTAPQRERVPSKYTDPWRWVSNAWQRCHHLRERTPHAVHPPMYAHGSRPHNSPRISTLQSIWRKTNKDLFILVISWLIILHGRIGNMLDLWCHVPQMSWTIFSSLKKPLKYVCISNIEQEFHVLSALTKCDKPLSWLLTPLAVKQDIISKKIILWKKVAMPMILIFHTPPYQPLHLGGGYVISDREAIQN